jgi:hypothetical protein
MKKRIVIATTLLSLILGAVMFLKPGRRTQAAMAAMPLKAYFTTFTNDAKLGPCAFLTFTNSGPTSVGYSFNSLERQTSDGWQRTTTKGSLFAGLLDPSETETWKIPLPSNGTWRVSIQYDVQSGGLSRIIDKATDIVTRSRTITGNQGGLMHSDEFQHEP